jgi:hypothetical protein
VREKGLKCDHDGRIEVMGWQIPGAPINKPRKVEKMTERNPKDLHDRVEEGPSFYAVDNIYVVIHPDRIDAETTIEKAELE